MVAPEHGPATSAQGTAANPRGSRHRLTSFCARSENFFSQQRTQRLPCPSLARVELASLWTGERDAAEILRRLLRLKPAGWQILDSTCKCPISRGVNRVLAPYRVPYRLIGGL